MLIRFLTIVTKQELWLPQMPSWKQDFTIMVTVTCTSMTVGLVDEMKADFFMPSWTTSQMVCKKSLSTFIRKDLCLDCTPVEAHTRALEDGQDQKTTGCKTRKCLLSGELIG